MEDHGLSRDEWHALRALTCPTATSDHPYRLLGEVARIAQEHPVPYTTSNVRTLHALESLARRGYISRLKIGTRSNTNYRIKPAGEELVRLVGVPPHQMTVISTLLCTVATVAAFCCWYKLGAIAMPVVAPIGAWALIELCRWAYQARQMQCWKANGFGPSVY